MHSHPGQSGCPPTGRRIAAHASGALTDLKDAETADAKAVSFLQVLRHQADEVAEDRFGLLLCHFVSVGESVGDMLQGDGRRCDCFCHRKLLLTSEQRRSPASHAGHISDSRDT